jgi:hypothetical protein
LHYQKKIKKKLFIKKKCRRMNPIKGATPMRKTRNRKPKNMNCSTTQYLASHGKKPRGNGNWAFGNLDEIMFINGTYSKAKKQAAAHFKGWFQVLP